MRKSLSLLLLLVCSVAYAEMEVGYDHYLTPNGGNNYTDAYGFSAKYGWPVSDKLSVFIEGSHLTDIGFPVVDDPKGSFGELRGFGGFIGTRLKLPEIWKLKPYALAAAGGYAWDFRENPFLQGNRVNVEVDPSLAFKAGLGATLPLSESWTVGFEAGWFDTNIPKEAVDDKGTEWNILDDDEIGIQYIYINVYGMINW